MKKSNVVVMCGSRLWTDRKMIRRAIRELPPGTIIRHGAARDGADYLIDKIAGELGYEVDPMPADWRRYGKAAGPIRNSAMLEKEPVPYRVIAFWIGNSRGTGDTIKKAGKLGIQCDVHSGSSINLRIEA